MSATFYISLAMAGAFGLLVIVVAMHGKAQRARGRAEREAEEAALAEKKRKAMATIDATHLDRDQLRARLEQLRDKRLAEAE